MTEQRARGHFLFPNAIKITVEGPNQEVVNGLLLEIQAALFRPPAPSNDTEARPRVG